MANRDVLITGGCGFVGRHLVRDLLSSDDVSSIVIVDNLSTGWSPGKWLDERLVGGPKYNLVNIEGTDVAFVEDDCRNFFKNSEWVFDDAYHLAAVIGGRESIDGEPLKVASDLSVDAEFFNWVVNNSGVERVLYASSSAAYPTSLQNPESGVLEDEEDYADVRKLRESDITFETGIGVPDMTYGWSKLTGEYLGRFAAEEYGIDVASIRPFSGYGGDQSFNYPTPSIAKRAIREEDPLTVWGTGKQTRDFIHIEDCVEGMHIALDEISDGSAVNLGRGEPVNFLEVAETFAELVGYDPEIKNLPDKPEGVKYRVADTTRMEEVLDWEPKYDLHDGFTEVVNTVSGRIDEPAKVR